MHNMDYDGCQKDFFLKLKYFYILYLPLGKIFNHKVYLILTVTLKNKKQNSFSIMITNVTMLVIPTI